MNKNIEYSEALTELDILLQNLDEKLIQKIPIKLREFIQKNKSKNYVPRFNVNTKINKSDLKLKTRELLAYIYRNYLCDENERIEYDIILKRNEDRYQNEIREKYNEDNLFKNKKYDNQNNIDTENCALVEYKDTNFLRKIIEKMQSFLK